MAEIREQKQTTARAKTKLVPGDLVSIYYSPKVMETVPAEPVLVNNQSAFSVWGKLRRPDVGRQPLRRPLFHHWVVEQQLDRPTSWYTDWDRYVWGLTVLAHSKSAAAHLSRNFRNEKQRRSITPSFTESYQRNEQSILQSIAGSRLQQ